MYRIFLIGLSLFTFMIAGCGAKLDDTQKSALKLAAISAKERATSLVAIKDRLRAKNEADALPLKNFLEHHTTTLARLSAELADFVKAAETGSTLDNQSRKALAEDVKTWASSARNFALAKNSIKPDPAVDEWVKAHSDALLAQADAIQRVATLFPPKLEKAEVPK